jgi:multiple sugar transport system permease protein
MTNNNEVKNITFREKWQEFKHNWSDPTKKRVRNRKVGNVTGNFLRTFILIGLCFIIVLPVFQKISYAIRSPYSITDPQVMWIPDVFSTEIIKMAAAYLVYNVSLVNSLILSFIIALIQVIATAIAGYSFARLRFKGNNIIFGILIFTLVVPNETLYLSRKFFFDYTSFFGVDLLRTIFSVYIMSAFGMGIRSGIFIYLFRQFFRGIPIELEESAEIDGAGVIKTFWSVMLPNATGAITTVSLFAFVWQYNDYHWAILYRYPRELLTVKLASGSGNLSAILMSSFKSFINAMGKEIASDSMFFGLLINTAALLMMAPLLIGYFFFQRRFVESIERTGITGM